MAEYKPKFAHPAAGASSVPVDFPTAVKQQDVGALAAAVGALKPPTNLSFLEEHEKPEAQALIDKQFMELCGKKLTGRATRFFCIVKIHIRPEEMKEITDVTGKKTTLYLPDMIRAEDKYQSCVGLVVALGPDCFKNKDGTPRGSQYSVGDFVCFPRTDIIRVDFRGVALGVMTDDRAIMVVDDPSDWTQGIFSYKA